MLRAQTPHVSAAMRFDSKKGKLIGFAPEMIDMFKSSDLFDWILVEADGAARRPFKAPASHEPVIPDCTDTVIGVVGLEAIGTTLDDKSVFRPECISKISGLALGMEIKTETICTVLCHRNGIFQGAPDSATQIVFLNKADKATNALAGQAVMKILGTQKGIAISRVVLGSMLLDPPVLAYRDLY
jgi:probable selenium-dependent hydroxylase accessory protein YqeC